MLATDWASEWASDARAATIRLFMNGQWRDGSGGESAVTDPASGEELGWASLGNESDLREAVELAASAFADWKRTSPYRRSTILRNAAAHMRQEAESIALGLVREQGKILVEARAEVAFSCEILEWCAEEARRQYGRVVAPRADGFQHTILREPLGVAVLVPSWNAPVLFVARKLGECLAAGCTAVLLGSRHAPASAARVVRAFEAAGAPPGVVNLVFGRSPDATRILLSSPAVRKLSFTGSASVARALAAQLHDPAVSTTFELGGHAPAIVFDDVDIEETARTLAASKFRNAGQVCNSPTRIYVQSGIYEHFVTAFVAHAEALSIGPGLNPHSAMGPLTGAHRIAAMQNLVDDALSHGAILRTGGRSLEGPGTFYLPTVLERLDSACRVMLEEPFGPIACMIPFDEPMQMLREANALPFGLAGYVYTRDLARARLVQQELDVGLLGINTPQIALAETPFGGGKQSGHGSEGGTEGISAYTRVKAVTEFTPPYYYNN